MAYDKDLADRIRQLIGVESAVSEKEMFGGLAFLLSGNMALAARNAGGMMVRVDPAEVDRLILSDGAHTVEMRGRRMKGWVHVTPEQLRHERDLAHWVGQGVSYARSLPPNGSAA